MSKALKAADDIRNLSARFQAILDLGAYLEGVGKIEQLGAEAQQQVDTARAELVTLRKDIEQASKDKALLIAQGHATIASAQAQADGMIAAATKNAEAVRAEAEQQRAALAAQNAQARQDYEDMKSKRQAAIDGMDAVIAARQATYHELLEQIAAIRAKLG